MFWYILKLLILLPLTAITDRMLYCIQLIVSNLNRTFQATNKRLNGFCIDFQLSFITTTNGIFF